ncbi:tRNA pseudouridine32 synthase/23S rRNA pseudouridine746 synthase [Crossiella equi]|uniref:RNA pseudouridylate synthase n=2 Tax=Crossiella equi TaxID=130796 RepID=A0ABS5AN58_9PSEU|nr:RluA family pseudouridine synthase [Crossiella equi]MBP2477980.1 tRNA pseudouridine32 synthase/23S rRNA pseudouridine746 synthase [Crossiella equi]
MRRKTPPPLPQRFGLDPARMRLPEDGGWATVRAHLAERLPMVAAETIDAMFTEGRIADLGGPLALDAPYVPGGVVWFHRELPVEEPVPFPITVVYRDERILVADKPHFLATIPRGKHIQQTALVKLRQEHGLPELSAAHRLDRVTAGLVLFVIRREDRGRYQTLFRDRLVGKEYEAIAPHDPDLALPAVVRSRIVKERGVITAQEVDGPVNAETEVELLATRDGLGRYRLRPVTGRTHQLRLHLSGLGIPILGDDFYPVLTDRPLDDFTRPLQLLARTLRFTDPVTGVAHEFHSGQTLRAWADYASWAGPGS